MVVGRGARRSAERLRCRPTIGTEGTTSDGGVPRPPARARALLPPSSRTISTPPRARTQHGRPQQVPRPRSPARLLVRGQLGPVGGGAQGRRGEITDAPSPPPPNPCPHSHPTSQWRLPFESVRRSRSPSPLASPPPFLPCLRSFPSPSAPPCLTAARSPTPARAPPALAEPGNILVHVVLVPLLFLTFQAFLAMAVPPPRALAPWTRELGTLAGRWPLRFELGGGTALAVLYEAYYLALDVPLGVRDPFPPPPPPPPPPCALARSQKRGLGSRDHRSK